MNFGDPDDNEAAAESTLKEDLNAGQDSKAPKDEEIKAIVDIVKPFYANEQYRLEFVPLFVSFMRRDLMFLKGDAHETMLQLDPGKAENINVIDEVYNKKSTKGMTGSRELEAIITRITGGNSDLARKTIIRLQYFSRARRKSKTMADVDATLNQIAASELLDEVYAVTCYSPLRLVVAHDERKQIIKASCEEIKDKDNQPTGMSELKFNDIIITATPTNIIKYDNRTRTDILYEMEFDSHAGKFKLGPGNVEEILAGLHSKNMIYQDRQAKDVLSAILNAYELAKKVRVDRGVETAGYYLVDGKILPNKTDQKDPTIEEIKKCANILDDLSTWYEYKIEAFSTDIKWSIMAPFGYIIKMRGLWLPWGHFHGWTGTGKTTLAKIPLAVWAKDLTGSYAKSFASFNREARLGEVLRRDTYPILIDEAGDLTESQNKNILEMIKHAVMNQISRGRFKSRNNWEDIEALKCCIIVSNDRPPSDPAYMRRLFSEHFSQKDQRDKNRAKEFEDWFRSTAAPALRTLGDFTARYMLSHQELLIGEHLRDWREIALEILQAFYREAGKENVEHQWIYRNLPDYDEVIEENVEEVKLSVRGFILNNIHQAYRAHGPPRKMDHGELIGSMPTLEEKLNFVLDHNLLSFLHWSKSQTHQDRINVTSDVRQEAKRQRIEPFPSSLEDVAYMMGLEYGWDGSGKKRSRVAFGPRQTLIDFLNIEDAKNDNDDPNQTKLG
jgi:hypothetical protein